MCHTWTLLAVVKPLLSGGFTANRNQNTVKEGRPPFLLSHQPDLLQALRFKYASNFMYDSFIY